MRKKKLLDLNAQLFHNVEKGKLMIDELQKEVSDLKLQVEKLTAENVKLKAEVDSPTPLEALEKKVKAQANISPATEYGAEIIGKIVVSAAQCCNRITAKSNTCDAKELVNLILGRTEVAKAEILKAVESDLEPAEKESLINSHQKAAEDYFCSVMAQGE